MPNRKVSLLNPHPENARIYGDDVDEKLLASVRAHGVYEPLLVTREGLIISGHRRWKAAKKAGLGEVPVSVFPSADDLDVLEALVHCNEQRVKTRYQVAQE